MPQQAAAGSSSGAGMGETLTALLTLIVWRLQNVFDSLKKESLAVLAQSLITGNALFYQKLCVKTGQKAESPVARSGVRIM